VDPGLSRIWIIDFSDFHGFSHGYLQNVLDPCPALYCTTLPSVHISLLCYHNPTVNHFPSETARLQMKIHPAWKKFEELQAETT